MKRAAGLALLLALLPAAAGAVVIYVRAGATGANTGTSWTDAYTSLQTALSAAVSSDEIWVAAATYKPTPGTDRTLSFAMKNGVGIYGGFAGTESARGQRDPVINVTILSGDIGTLSIATDNSHHVVTADATVTASGVLDGFTITGGQADGAGPVHDRGAGIYTDGGNPSIARCVLSGNFAGNRGGGVRVASGSATLTACVFQSNSASSAGGGLSAGAVVSVSLKDCVFRGNSVGNTTGGGAIEASDNTSATNCLVAGNSPNGIVFFQGNNSFVNCTVTGNFGYGAAFFAPGNSIANSILWGDGVGEVFLGPSADVAITYSDVQGGFGGTGNIASNPLFVNQAGGDLRLGSGSPAVDAGSNALVPGGTATDVAGLPRFFDDPGAPNTGSGTPPLVDMGAHERVPLAVSSPASQTVCAGAAASFSVTATGPAPLTYRWRKNEANLGNGGSVSGATTSTLTINPTAVTDSGNYDVVVTDPFSQAVTSTAAALTVNAIPGAPAASNNGPLCAGSTLQLTASTVAGASYSWTGPNAFSSTLQNPTILSVAAANAGTYSVTIAVNGCVSPPATTAVTVKPIPSPPTASNNGPICAGGTLQLTASTIAGASYSWTGPNGFASTQQNPTIPSATAAASGTYSVTATVNGCTSTPVTTSVTVKPIPSAPAAGNNGPICAGGTLQLTASTIAGASYSWSGPNGFTSAQQNPTIPSATTAASGTYSVTATVNGCTSATATTAASVNPPLSATITAPASVCAGSIGDAASVPDAGPGATYAWTIGNGSILSGAGTRSVIFSPGASGTVTLNVTVSAGGCAVNGSQNVAIRTPCAFSFHSVGPCRVLDTRNFAGPLGGPALAANTDRTFVVAGTCSVPTTAKAVSANLTVTQPSQQGHLRLYPGGTPLPFVSSINYLGGQTRANNAVLPLGASGDIAVRCVQAGGTVHFILDVNGYFE